MAEFEIECPEVAGRSMDHRLPGLAGASLKEARAAWFGPLRETPGHFAAAAELSNSFGLVKPMFCSFEPNRKQAASIETFVKCMNESPSQVGLQKGADAEKALMRLGETEGLIFPSPSTTPFFNMKEGRYVYTKDGGWIDMVHFLFYAGLAYQNKKDGVKNPVGEAMQVGYKQEYWDPAHSAYSYEDLPSDRFGALFAVNHFDPNSNLTLGEQIQQYMKDQLKAVDPKEAPNYASMPEGDSKNPPSRTNKTTKPVYTEANP